MDLELRGVTCLGHEADLICMISVDTTSKLGSGEPTTSDLKRIKAFVALSECFQRWFNY
jgi:hypothetical protein